MAKYIEALSRVCYENGNAKTDQKLYEFHGDCTCAGCTARKNSRRGNRNCITITTRDILKVKEAKEIIEKWTCADGSKWLKTEYVQI